MIKSQDDLNRPEPRSVDVLIKTIEKCEELKKMLHEDSNKYKKGACFESVYKKCVARIVSEYLEEYTEKEKDKIVSLNFKLTPQADDMYKVEAIIELDKR